MQNKNYGLWGGVTLGVVIIVLGLMWLVGSTPTPTPDGKIVPPPITASDWQKGPTDAPLTLIEYSDFQCPACALYYPLVKKVTAEYASTTRFVYRHFPLPQHLDAKIVAYAAEAAGQQGKFFEMHDILFDKQKEWGVDSTVLPTDPKELSKEAQSSLEAKIFAYAEELGLDLAKFRADMASKEIRDKIDTAVADGKSLDIPATPTFFLNDKQLVNPNGDDEFKKLLNAALQKS